MTSSLPTTIDDWRAASSAGPSPRALLIALQQRLEAERAPGVWISLADLASIESQVAVLEARATRVGDAEALRREMPLFGVPFAVKDNIDVAGFPTTAACPAYAYAATVHAPAVEKLVAAGAVCFGKTNLDQFATGLVGTRSPFGRPSSTFADDRISGGSSSGSALVVARGDVPFALGTDTAGSGRVPAAFNNIVGLKPTPGRVSTRGVVPACRSIDCVSVFALTVADAARILGVIEGPDPAEAFSAFATGPARLATRLRIGIPSQAIFFGDAGYGPAFERAVAHLRELEHEVVAVDFAPLHATAELLYGGPWVAERHVVVEALLERDATSLEPIVREVIGAARRRSATEVFRGLHTLREAQRDTRALWREVDLLMVPTTPGHPRHAEVDADPIGVNNRLGAYTNFVNLLGWCAVAVPAGLTTAGLPFGITFIAPAASDAALARFAVLWQESLGLPLGATSTTDPRAPIGEVSPWPASEETVPIAVCGAHLSGLPLNAELVELGATLREATRTAPHYRLFALAGTTPPRPGLVRTAVDGKAIAVEVWDVPSSGVGRFLAGIPAPLGLGNVELANGKSVHGFLCEAHASAGAEDVSAFGGWRAWLASRSGALGGTASP